MEKAAERRRMQNRLAQRNHSSRLTFGFMSYGGENMKKRITNLEKTNEYLVSKIFKENVASNPNTANQTIDIEQFLHEDSNEQFYPLPVAINTELSKTNTPKISSTLDSHAFTGESSLLDRYCNPIPQDGDDNQTAAVTLDTPANIGNVQYHSKSSEDRSSVFNTSQDRIQEALRVAVANSHIECVDVLLRSGANVDQVDNNGRSLLHLCSETGNAIVAQYLVRNGANTEVRDRWGLTPLLLAAHTGSAEVIKILIE
ncbi:uncharacterized protein TRUGW13939_02606 [Talaromyces rugulosus]|uniref:Uncharacterized protein n=1 Tax=Talaromyces rugulosus TaxID=121627 RepID=A0A7H8QQU2_TALRU|nr:uncharacterized protein TRUGW13939_02606 [Talaromyces rugulosus]QKX55513.1 hypothetical protein TRUGW13939_02606 [Talaromyces rugulosus]